MSIFPTKILLATDGSGEAELAARTTVDLSRRADSELHVVYVSDANPTALLYPESTDPEGVELPDPVLEEDLERCAEQRGREMLDAEVPVRCFLLNAEGVFYADTTAVEKLEALHSELQGKGATLAIARANAPLRETLERSGLIDKVGRENLFPSVRTGVKAYQEKELGRTGGGA